MNKSLAATSIHNVIYIIIPFSPRPGSVGLLCRALPVLTSEHRWNQGTVPAAGPPQPTASSVSIHHIYSYSITRTLSVFGVGPRCRPLATRAPRPPLRANPNLFRNRNMVCESTYLCMATTKSLFPMAPEWSLPRLTETESVIDSSTHNIACMPAHTIHTYTKAQLQLRLLVCQNIIFTPAMEVVFFCFL